MFTDHCSNLVSSIRLVTAIVLVFLFTNVIAGGQSVDELLDNVPAAQRDPNPWTWNREFIPGTVVILEPFGDLELGQESTFRLAILMGTVTDSLEIAINKISRLKYEGCMTWNAFGEKGDTLFFMLSVILPDNDTSGMEVVVSDPKGTKIEAACYLVTTSTPCQVWWSDPRNTPKRLRGPEIMTK